MKKVVYSIRKESRSDLPKITGIGYVSDSDLVIARVSQKGNPYVRVFEDCLKDCHPVLGKEQEFKGMYYELREYEGHDITDEYTIWYKIV